LGLWVRFKREVNLPESDPDDSIGLALEGAVWNGSELVTNVGETVSLKLSQLKWTENKTPPSENSYVSTLHTVNYDDSHRFSSFS
jgi:hypothetical protein